MHPNYSNSFNPPPNSLLYAETKKNESPSILNHKMEDLIQSNECIAKKVILLSDQVSDILKALCNSCSSRQMLASNEASQQMCSTCNAIFCFDCVKQTSCEKCNKRRCQKHSIKCQICNRRVCKSMICLAEFTLCECCKEYFCPSDFDVHWKLMQYQLSQIKCTNVKSSFLDHFEKKNLLDLTLLLSHSTMIKELRIRMFIIRKQPSLRKWNLLIIECVQKFEVLRDFIH